MGKKFGIGGLILVLLVVALGVYKSLQEPADLWLQTKTFAGCPNRPSCVSSVATDARHAIAPLQYQGDAAYARTALQRAVLGMPNTHLVHATPEYLHVLFLTPLMRFHDDVELLMQPDGIVQVRSISRFGYGDHGVNRARVEAIREAFSGQNIAAAANGSPK